MRELKGLFLDQQSARVAIDALREAGFSAAIVEAPEPISKLKRQQAVFGGQTFNSLLDEETEELIPVHLRVVYPYLDTVERILKKKGALTVQTNANAPFA